MRTQTSSTTLKSALWLRDSAQVQAVVKQAIDRYGRIDVLMYVAGSLRERLFSTSREETWDYILDTNLRGAFLTI
jgi:3-oxoacyl-[acyl-carrier protein] reductase